jgi:hypothetical protein
VQHYPLQYLMRIWQCKKSSGQASTADQTLAKKALAFL